MKIEIETNFKEFREAVSKVEPARLKRVIAHAATETGFYVRNKVQSEMPKYIDRPKPFTRNSLFVKKGTSKSPEATVMWRPGSLSGNSAGKYLVPIATGTNRPAKGFERLLRSKGVLPVGQYMVPTKDAPTDAFGNVPGSYIVKMISFFRAFRDTLMNRVSGARAKAERKKVQFFAVAEMGGKGGLAPGVYERISIFGGAIRKVFSFTRQVTYKRSFPFADIATKAATDKFPSKFSEALDKFSRQSE